MNPVLIVIPTLDKERGDGTGKLARATAGCETRLAVSHDARSQGFTRAVNRGLARRRHGEDVCILNDDVYGFPYSWLRTLQDALYSRDRLGIVGPSGRSASSPNAGKLGDAGIQPVKTIPFWCAVVRAEVIEMLGALDPAFIHYSSDTWYCIQAALAGWEVAWVKPVYLWHEHEGSGFRHEWREHDTRVFNKRIMELALKR
jgi:GT2 family glycosyltransferase